IRVRVLDLRESVDRPLGGASHGHGSPGVLGIGAGSAVIRSGAFRLLLPQHLNLSAQPLDLCLGLALGCFGSPSRLLLLALSRFGSPSRLLLLALSRFDLLKFLLHFLLCR